MWIFPHSDDFRPWNVGVSRPGFRRFPPDCFSSYLELMDHPEPGHFALKILSPPDTSPILSIASTK
jgi:hypothetical protein